MRKPTEERPNPDSKTGFESGFTRAARRFFRWYRNGPRLAHPVVRRALRSMMSRHQRIILRSGLRLQIDLDRVVQETIFWYDGDMEPQLSWAVREFLPVGGTLVDCGANCGYIGLEARLQRGARVVFVEPHPELADSIRRNIALNGWDDSCRLIQAGASDHPGSASLYISRGYDGSHSLLADWWKHEGEAEKVEVPLVTLGQVLRDDPGLARVDFVKIDTEGHDFSVLQGLGDRLDPGVIAMLYVELGRDRDEAWRLLRDRGYVGFIYPARLKSVALRRAVLRAADGEPVVFYLPLDQCQEGAETLWCGRGTPAEAFLRERAGRRA